MPTFKGKDGKPVFSMNPQVGKAMHGSEVPGMDAVSGKDGTAPAAALDDNGDSDCCEMHHGGNPEGQPEPHEGTAYHTIHKDSMGNPKEIRNHDDYDGAESHVREVMDNADSEHDNGDSDVDDQAGESAVFE